MKILKEITDNTVGLSNEVEKFGTPYELRKSARAIVLNEHGEMATQYLNTYTYHKLPGGGVDTGETIEQALKREVLEEVGCDCAVIQELGVTIEYRNKYKLLHISYGFVAAVVGEVGTPALEEGEIEEGQETLWLKPEMVLEKMGSDTPGKYEGHFILEREKAFLTEFLNKAVNN
ncbi:MAG: NUDIX domain-containing protein [Candidatus Paceibacterota bacterium]